MKQFSLIFWAMDAWSIFLPENIVQCAILVIFCQCLGSQLKKTHAVVSQTQFPESQLSASKARYQTFGGVNPLTTKTTKQEPSPLFLLNIFLP